MPFRRTTHGQTLTLADSPWQNVAFWPSHTKKQNSGPFKWKRWGIRISERKPWPHSETVLAWSRRCPGIPMSAWDSTWKHPVYRCESSPGPWSRIKENPNPKSTEDRERPTTLVPNPGTIIGVICFISDREQCVCILGSTQRTELKMALHSSNALPSPP